MILVKKHIYRENMKNRLPMGKENTNKGWFLTILSKMLCYKK